MLKRGATFRALMEAVGARLQVRYGFDPKPRHNGLHLVTKLGYARIAFTCVPRSQCFDVVVYVGVEFRELGKLMREEMLRHRDPLRPRRLPEIDVTMSERLNYLNPAVPPRWIVYGEEEIKETADSITDSFTLAGWPYVSRYLDNLEAAYNALRDLDEKTGGLSHIPADHNLGRTVVGLAYLLGRREEFETEVKRFAEFIRRRRQQPHGLQEFLNFVEFLREKGGPDWGLPSDRTPPLED